MNLGTRTNVAIAQSNSLIRTCVVHRRHRRVRSEGASGRGATLDNTFALRAPAGAADGRSFRPTSGVVRDAAPSEARVALRDEGP